MEPFVGEIRCFGFGWAPVGWAPCQGQLLPISSNTALFSLLGTTYGGDGRTTFALPDLRGRTPVNQGQGPGLSSYDLGQVGGTETVTLIAGQLPPHNHTVTASSTASGKSPSGSVPAYDADSSSYGGGTDLQMSPSMVGGGGNSQPVDNMQPYLAVSWCIAVEGIYPSRP